MNTSEIPALKKHSYPSLIFYSGLISILLFITATPLFVIYELPYHKKLQKDLAIADRFFTEKNYETAIQFYNDFLNSYPLYSKSNNVKMRLAQSYFALGESDEYYYALGWEYLENRRYKKSEIQELEAFVPERYKEHFKSQFKWT